MPSGKRKSKEDTWTEKDLTNAIQGEKPRRSKDGRKQRESRDQQENHHSTERNEEDRERDRRRRRSERHREDETLDVDERQRSHDRETKQRHKERESGSSEKKDRRQKERNGEEEHDDDRRKHRDKEKSRRRREDERNREEEDEGDDRRKQREKEDRSKEKSRRHRGDPDESNHEKKRRERNREDENKDDDRRRHQEKEERGKEGRRHREDPDESNRDRKHRDDRKYERRKDTEEDHETERQRNKDERRREKHREEGSNDKEKRRRDRETDEQHRRRDKDERRKERHKSPDDHARSEKKNERNRRVDEDDDDERERRRRKQERREAREKNKNGNDDDDDRKDKRSEDENKRKRREDGKKMKERDLDDQNERLNEDKKGSELRKKESAGKLESNGKSLTNTVEVDDEIPNEDVYDEYEDDFEDYEDDFEDEEEMEEQENGYEQDRGKLLEIFEAINAENDDVRRSPFQQKTVEESREEETSKPVTKSIKSEPHGRINFFAAKQKHVTEFVASKTKKRAQELQNLIELDVASYDIFDLPPLNEYELYIKSYGQSDSKQAYVQCHDDIVEKEMQTEVIEMSTKWTQYPPDDFKGSGDDTESREGDDLPESVFTPHSVDSVRLTNFLQQAGQVCLILLEEKNSATKELMFKERNDLDISDGCIQLSNKLPFLEGRRVLDTKFNLVQTHLLLTAHDCGEVETSEDKDSSLQGRGVVCYWNANEPSQPQKILYCESSPKSCCFSPVKSSLVFAGLEDGSVVVWDLRESSSIHSTINNKDRQWVIRRPTFSTAGVLSNENHLTQVQKILPIAHPVDSAQALSRSAALQDEPGGMAFQLASLDENGVVNIWVVIELDKPDEAGSENDLGLAPGGRVKLIKSTSIQVESPHREMFFGSSVQTSVMQFSTIDPNHFYVGTDRGWVVHCTRYGGKTHPKVYRPLTESFVTISALDVSPWNIPLMLVGCTDGTLRLHDLRKEHAIRSWSETTQGQAIVQIMWSRSRPSLFFVLDAKSNLYIWNLLQKDGHPVEFESFKRGKLLFFSLSNDYESLGIGLPGRKSELVLSYEDGMIELHRLKEELTNVEADELDRFASFVDLMI